MREFSMRNDKRGSFGGMAVAGMGQVQDRYFCVDLRKRLTLSIVCIKIQICPWRNEEKLRVYLPSFCSVN